MNTVAEELKQIDTLKSKIDELKPGKDWDDELRPIFINSF